MPGGRPTDYNQEIAARVCEWIAEGNSLRSFTREHEDSPALSSLCLWIVTHDEFSEQYRRAREAAGYAHADDILEVVNEARQGLLEPHVAKVVMDGKKWAAERMAPKTHSPRQELTGANGGAVHVTGVDLTFVSPKNNAADG